MQTNKSLHIPKERSYQGKAAIDVWKIIFAHVVNSEEILSNWEKPK